MSNIEEQEEWSGKERTLSDENETRVLYAALDSFYQYSKIAAFNTTHLRRQSFYSLPQAHWKLLAGPPFSYLDTLTAVDDAIDNNAKLAMAIHKSGLEAFGVSSVSKEWQGFANASDMDKARSTLRQFYRDWSSEGIVERDACLQPVIVDILNEFPKPSGKKVLVPGAGLARLVFELCQRGFETEGNEISFHQLLASSYILNHCPEAGEHKIHPWVHSFSNHLTRDQQLQSVSIPDINPSTLTVNEATETGAMSMSASDFLCYYGTEACEESFDAVATVFFLDTAPNPIRYIETIRSCLKPGGVWVNCGPLLWHFENNAPGTHGRGDKEKDKASNEDQGIADPGSVELTNDEVMKLVEALGFKIETSEIRNNVGYIQDPRSMMQSTYNVSHWVARKVERRELDMHIT